MNSARLALPTLTLTVTAVIAGAGCSGSVKGSSGGQLRGVNHGGGQAAMGLEVKSGLPYELPLRPLCTATGAPAQIESVTPWNLTGDIRIVDWGVRIEGPHHPGGPDIGAEQMTVKQVGGFNHGPVTVRCSETITVQEFYISASTTTARSTMDGVTVRYDGNRTAHIQFGIALCVHAKDCEYNFR